MVTAWAASAFCAAGKSTDSLNVTIASPSTYSVRGVPANTALALRTIRQTRTILLGGGRFGGLPSEPTNISTNMQKLNHSRGQTGNTHPAQEKPGQCQCPRSVLLLIRLVKVKKRLIVCPIREPTLPLHLLQFVRLVIPPPALGQKRVEDEKLFVVRPAALCKTPLQNLLILRPRQHALHHRRIFHLQKPANPRIGSGPASIVPRQLSLRVEPYLIQHPPEENQSPDLLGRRSETGNFHGVEVAGFVICVGR